MTDPEPISTTLDGDLPCFSCGYNLRGLQNTGLCPECGGEIARSIEEAAHSGPTEQTVRFAFRLALLLAIGLLMGIPVAFCGFPRSPAAVPALAVPASAALWAVGLCASLLPMVTKDRYVVRHFKFRWFATVLGSSSASTASLSQGGSPAGAVTIARLLRR